MRLPLLLVIIVICDHGSLSVADGRALSDVGAKLHYTDTGYGHHQRTSSLQQICHIAMPEPNISTCQDVGMWQIFVRRWCPCSEVWL